MRAAAISLAPTVLDARPAFERGPNARRIAFDADASASVSALAETIRCKLGVAQPRSDAGARRCGGDPRGATSIGATASRARRLLRSLA